MDRALIYVNTILVWRAADSNRAYAAGPGKRRAEKSKHPELTLLTLDREGSIRTPGADARTLLQRNPSVLLSSAWTQLRRFVQSSLVPVGDGWPPRCRLPSWSKDSVATLDYRGGLYVLESN